MQPKYTHNPSNIIKATEEAKRKSRHRLIGSIVLLFFALIVLLNVTAKVKPIAINPNVVEIKNTQESNLAANAHSSASNPLTQASGVVVAKPTESALSSGVQSAENPAQILNQTNSVAVKPTTQTRQLPLQGTVSQATEQAQTAEIAPPVVTKPKKVKPIVVSPADILNDTGQVDNLSQQSSDEPTPAKVSATTVGGKSYVQFAALSSPEKAQQFQTILANHGINATIQPIKTEKGTLYRLRAGPFNRDLAVQKLQKMTNEGYSGIVTGN